MEDTIDFSQMKPIKPQKKPIETQEKPREPTEIELLQQNLKTISAQLLVHNKNFELMQTFLIDKPLKEIDDIKEHIQRINDVFGEMADVVENEKKVTMELHQNLIKMATLKGSKETLITFDRRLCWLNEVVLDKITNLGEKVKAEFTLLFDSIDKFVETSEVKMKQVRV